MDKFLTIQISCESVIFVSCSLQWPCLLSDLFEPTAKIKRAFYTYSPCPIATIIFLSPGFMHLKIWLLHVFKHLLKYDDIQKTICLH